MRFSGRAGSGEKIGALYLQDVGKTAVQMGTFRKGDQFLGLVGAGGSAITGRRVWRKRLEIFDSIVRLRGAGWLRKNRLFRATEPQAARNMVLSHRAGFRRAVCDSRGAGRW